MYDKFYNQRHNKDPTNENIPPLPIHKKLVPNLQNKTNYIVHGLNLKFYVQLTLSNPNLKGKSLLFQLERDSIYRKSLKSES